MAIATEVTKYDEGIVVIVLVLRRLSFGLLNEYQSLMFLKKFRCQHIAGLKIHASVQGLSSRIFIISCLMIFINMCLLVLDKLCLMVLIKFGWIILFDTICIRKFYYVCSYTLSCADNVLDIISF